MSSIKVAHVTTSPVSLKYLLHNQLLTLRERGFDVTAISGPGPEIETVEHAGIRHITVPFTRAMGPAQDFSAFARLYRVFRRERFTIVHTHNPKPGLLGQIAARLAGTPVIVNTVHGFYFHEHSRPTARMSQIALERFAARFSDGILTQSREDLDTALRDRIAAQHKLRFLGNGIDLTHFDHRAPVDRNEIRRELAIDPDQPVIGFVGRLVREKGLLELFEAVRLIRTRLPRVVLLVIGPADPLKPDHVSPQIAGRFEIADSCRFLGLRDDLHRLYRIMDVFALPSYREGMPRSAMEASALGVPAVVTDVRGCREVVEHGKNGLVVPPRNARALADALYHVLSNSDLAATLAANGPQIAAARFDERAIFESVVAEYTRLLAQKQVGVSAIQARAVPLAAMRP